MQARPFLPFVLAIMLFPTFYVAEMCAAAPVRLPPMGAPLSPSHLLILPMEHSALTATVSGVRGFSALMDGHADVAKLWPSFVDSTHLMQTNLGSIRFFHTANQNYRAQGEAPMTDPVRLRKLREWTRGFRREVAAAPYSDAHRHVMRDFLRAGDGILSLSARYPDQHVYDDAQRGLVQIDALLRRAWDSQDTRSRPD